MEERVITGETIINALKVIKRVCEDNGNSCKHCPFEAGGVCAITDLEPANWKIEKPRGGYVKWE